MKIMKKLIISIFQLGQGPAVHFQLFTALCYCYCWVKVTLMYFYTKVSFELCTKLSQLCLKEMS